MPTVILAALPSILNSFVSMLGVINAGGKVASTDILLLLSKLDDLIKLVDANDVEWRKNNPG
jgi:hypothetical protein